MFAEELKLYSHYRNQLNVGNELLNNKAFRIESEYLIERYENFLLDGFGTLYIKDRTFSETHIFLDTLRKANKNIRLLTNSASKTGHELIDDLKTRGLEFEHHEVISSGDLFNDLALKLNIVECFHVGKKSAESLFLNSEIHFSNSPKQSIVALTSYLDDALKMEEQLNVAKEILSTPNSLLIVCNPDAYAPTLTGTRNRVSGHFAEVLRRNTLCNTVYLGKPFPLIYEKALRSLLPSTGATLAIGDTLGTDVLGAGNIGIDSALLLQGNTIEDQMREDFYQLSTKPNYLLNSLI